MAKPFDATLNKLVDLNPTVWADYFARVVGVPTGPSVPIDTDLASSLQADRIFRIESTEPMLLHLELECNPRLGIPQELMRYNTLIATQHNLPVETVLILLRRKALASDQNGLYERRSVTGQVIATFRYHLFRVWEQSVDFWLSGGPGLAPLALLTNEAEANLEEALDRLKSRLTTPDVSASEREAALSGSYFLGGLIYDTARIRNLFRSLHMILEESTTYQETLRIGEARGIAQGEARGEARGIVQGEARGLRESLSLIGSERFGPASQGVLQQLANLSADQLRSLSRQILVVGSWDELMAKIIPATA